MDITLTQMRYFREVVTQPTLSMQIQKFESLLGVQVLDRSFSPPRPTPIGRKILEQCQTILEETDKIADIVHEESDTVQGNIRVAIIPTLAPYLSPLFLQSLLKKFPGLTVEMHEKTTRDIIEGISQSQIDFGILATPLNIRQIAEHPMFYEPFLIYANSAWSHYDSKTLDAKDLKIDDLFILNEGHCMRSQMLSLCSLRKERQASKQRLSFSSGSIETLMRMVENNEGYTIVPKLAANKPAGPNCRFIPFSGRPPVREIGLVCHQSYARKSTLKAIISSIQSHLPDGLYLDTKGLKRIEFEY
jgi:LysR family transcriptional regulator, hydrogen peroxide-inducible genes activator